MTMDGSRRQIQFPQCPELTFSSMHSAFNYFEAQANLQKLRTFQVAEQRANHAVQQSRLARTVEPRIAPLEPAKAKPLVSLPTLIPEIRGPEFELAAESASQDTRKASNPVQPSSQSSPPEIPPQTLFDESTPHAQDVEARSRVRLPTKQLQSLPSRSRVMNRFHLRQPLPWLPPPNPVAASVEEDTAPRTYPDILLPSYTPRQNVTPDQPQSLHDSSDPLSSYSDTVLPRTLAKKDRRVLGVPVTAGIDEYVPWTLHKPFHQTRLRLELTWARSLCSRIRAAFWLRDFQYDADLRQAVSHEERVVAALRLRRAQEAVDRLCGPDEFDWGLCA